MRRVVQGNGHPTGTIPRNINQTPDNMTESRDRQRNVPFSSWQQSQPWNLAHGQRPTSTPIKHAYGQDARQLGYQDGGTGRCHNSASCDSSGRESVQSIPQNQCRSEGVDRRQYVGDSGSSKPMRRNILPYSEVDKSNITKRVIAGERKIPNARNAGRHASMAPCRNATDDLTGAIFKSTGTDHRNELKLKMEESQRKLKEMQAHHAALQDMKHKAQEQLKMTRAAQSRLVCRQMDPSRNESEQNSDSLQLDIDNIRERIQNLNGLYESHNEMIDLIGDHDEELMTEHQALQDKLHELQSKKLHVENLVADLQSLNTEPSQSGMQADDSSSKDGSMIELSYPDQSVSQLQDSLQDSRCLPGPSRSVSVIDDDMSNCVCPSALKENIDVEIEKLTTQISQLTNDRPRSRLPSTSPENLDHIEHEEQAVNLSRQRQGRGQGGVATTKRDNIAQANIAMMEGSISPRGDSKLAEFQKANKRLNELKDVLNKVLDLKSHGEAIPRELLRVLHTPELERNGESDCHPSDVGTLQRDLDISVITIPESLDSHQESIHELAYNLHMAEQNFRLKKMRQGLQEKKTNAQADVQAHQHQLLAKRKELEELMRKDQGRTSALNQDVCSEISATKSDMLGYSTGNATWGSSIPDPVEELIGYEGDVQESAPLRNEAMSLDSTFGGGTMGGETDDIAFRGGGNSLAHHLPSHRPQRSDSHNTWQKESGANATGQARAKWTSSSQAQAPSRNMNRGHEVERNPNCPCQNSCHNQQALFQNPLDTNNAAQQNSLPPTWVPPISCRASPDVFYQQLLAATQVQQQQLLLTTMNQVSYILWLQQRDMSSLRSVVTSLQEKAHQNGGNVSPSTNLTIHPEEPLMLPADSGNVHPLSQYGSVSNPSHQPLKVSYSGGLFQQHEALPGSSGVTSAHSLPNLAPTSVPVSGLSENPLLPGLQRTVYVSSPSSQTAPVAPWLEVPEHLQGNGTNVTPAALNNQVPPGNRANNYWDNFRSYSRQNLLSANRKSNEGTSHSASPLVGRSRNALRSSAELEIPTSLESDPLHGSYEPNAQVTSSDINQPSPANFHLEPSGSPVTYPVCFLPQAHNLARKIKLNTEQQSQQTMSYDSASNLSAQPGPISSEERDFLTKCNTRRSSMPLLSEPGDFAERISPDEFENDSRILDMTSSVYEEVKALLSANEERPHYLIQLFRDLQLVCTDTLRQHTLNAVHDLVSQYLIRTNDGRAQSATEHMMHDGTTSRTSLDDIPMPPVYLGRSCKPQSEMAVPALVLEILSYLNQHVNEICSPDLLKSIVDKVLALLETSYGNTPFLVDSSRDQIKSSLELVLGKFQGYRLEEVFQEVLSSLSLVLKVELTCAEMETMNPPSSHMEYCDTENERTQTAVSSEGKQDKQEEVLSKENEEETEEDADGKEEEKFISVELPDLEEQHSDEPALTSDFQ